MAAGQEEAELSQERTEQLLQFQDLTGIEDMQECRRVLESHNWNIEAAVHDTLNEAEGSSPVFRQPEPPPRPSMRPPMVDLQPRDQRVYTIARRHPMTWLQWGYMLVFLPFRFVYTTILDLFRITLRLFRPDARRIVTDPVGDVMTFIRSYEETYGPVHPIFYQGTYGQALNDAKRELKFLLVYLHNEDHQDTDEFCRNTLGSNDVCEFINSQMLFWAASVSTPEGYRVSLTLRGSIYPLLTFIVLRDNKMTVVARIQGPISGEDLIERLGQIMEDNEGALTATRMEREERNHTHILRQEQDAAYLESLRADEEKERRKQEEKERKQRQEDEKQRKVDEKKRQQEERKQLKITKSENLPSEPDSDDPNAVKLVLKFPNGTRIERRFLNSESVQVLYDYVFCNENAPEEFHIVTNFPRKVLSCDVSNDDNGRPMTLSAAGLGKTEMLFVQDIADDDEDDS
ncbi:FAS-associated factor 2-like [Ptychodera flava]|uniref:FAS-associated factor 2-like n=1 Tax=Ptychodera flava TaxID=63121 RepID=UPI00396A15F3